mgnify:CR=1 FL=1
MGQRIYDEEIDPRHLLERLRDKFNLSMDTDDKTLFRKAYSKQGCGSLGTQACEDRIEHDLEEFQTKGVLPGYVVRQAQLAKILFNPLG